MSLPVYSVVAYSGTGKTTFLENLIPELRKMGLRVAAVKHDAHEFDVDHEGKDTWRMTQAGAEVTCITSATHAAVMENRPTTIESIIAGLRDIDVVIAEGYKQKNYKKIGLYRAASRRPLAEIQGEFLAVCTDTPLDLDVPQFKLDDYAAVAEFIREDMGKMPVHHELYGSVQIKLGRKGPDPKLAFGKGLVELLEGIPDEYEETGSLRGEASYEKALNAIRQEDWATAAELLGGVDRVSLKKKHRDVENLYLQACREAGIDPYPAPPDPDAGETPAPAPSPAPVEGTPGVPDSFLVTEEEQP